MCPSAVVFFFDNVAPRGREKGGDCSFFELFSRPTEAMEIFENQFFDGADGGGRGWGWGVKRMNKTYCEFLCLNRVFIAKKAGRSRARGGGEVNMGAWSKCSEVL